MKFTPRTRVEYRRSPDTNVTETFEVANQAGLDRNVAKLTADPDAWDVAVRDGATGTVTPVGTNNHR